MSWIKIDTAIPSHSCRCLVVTKNDPMIRPAIYINDGKEIPWRWWDNLERPMKSITHWMPFPKMPEVK